MASTATDSGNTENGWTTESAAPRHRRLTIPELLASRQTVVRAYCPSTTTTLRSPTHCHQEDHHHQTTALASAVAWNRCRMQNMILAVGPGTPLDKLREQQAERNENEYQELQSSSSSSSDDGMMEHQDEVMMEQQQNEEDHDASMSDHEIMEQDDDKEEQNDDGHQNRNESDDAPAFRRRLYLGNDARSADLVEQIVLEYLENDDDIEDDASAISIPEEETVASPMGHFVPSIRHAGCINTATWLTSPWRLSLIGSGSTDDDASSALAVDSTDCPTQLLTSGDDRTVRFWDVRYAMGTASPLPGGQYSQCPFADESECKSYDWEQHHEMADRHHHPLAGSVIPLARLSTGHRGNVFHVTPIDCHPGKVLTCAADGYLRMSDVHRPDDSSTVVVCPDADSDLDDMLPLGLFRRSAMCFSHHFINANTGLLCGERGLKRFDLRLPPREQSSRSLLGNNKTCKSCAIWSASLSSLDDIDSAYVFAGGASSEVALYDLRMTDDSRSRIVQKYRPRGLGASSDVSVSGLDVSKDKRELLVSYENDQIFSFPVFPNTLGGRPTVDELSDYCSLYGHEDDDGPVLSELAAYGGHLNRFTFLKNAKYAGPQDEYICTGSDSGRAWIYDRATGTVAAFLAADHSTCNGVVPHPTLPLFITYGIDSTAKVWRATNPVDRDADDSPLGRARRYHQSHYEKSSLVRNWTYVKATAASIATLDEDVSESVTIFPDQLPVNDDTRTMGNSILGGILMRRRLNGMRGTRPSGIFNDFLELPNILQRNLFSCVIAEEEGESEPVSSGLGDLVRRMSTIRLCFQADQRGLIWNAHDPWVLGSRAFYKGKDLKESEPRSKVTDSLTLETTLYGNPFDIIPESPSDWIPYDRIMTHNPVPFGPRFNAEDYADFWIERYSHLGPYMYKSESKATEVGWIETSKSENCDGQESEGGVPYNSERALVLLHGTALMLKEGGNAALEAGSVMEAARRYDCAIKYCALCFLLHPNANQDFLRETEKKWCPLRKVLVATRLNLCMLLCNVDLRGAREQAALALKELAPFCMKPGKVMGGKKLSHVHKDDEPLGTFREAKELQAKAHFRLGSVYMKIGSYEEAVKELEESINCTKELSKEPDRFVLRRLGEAKRENSTKNKRQKKKIRRMFARDLTVLAKEKDGNDKDGDSCADAYPATS